MFKFQILDSKFRKKVISWLLAFLLVFPPYFVVFSPNVFAKLQEVVRDMGGTFLENEKYAFIGIDANTERSAVFFFDGNKNVKIPHDGVRHRPPQARPRNMGINAPGCPCT